MWSLPHTCAIKRFSKSCNEGMNQYVINDTAICVFFNIYIYVYVNCIFLYLCLSMKITNNDDDRWMTFTLVPAKFLLCFRSVYALISVSHMINYESYILYVWYEKFMLKLCWLQYVIYWCFFEDKSFIRWPLSHCLRYFDRSWAGILHLFLHSTGLCTPHLCCIFGGPAVSRFMVFMIIGSLLHSLQCNRINQSIETELCCVFQCGLKCVSSGNVSAISNHSAWMLRQYLSLGSFAQVNRSMPVEIAWHCCPKPERAWSLPSAILSWPMLTINSAWDSLIKRIA